MHNLEKRLKEAIALLEKYRLEEATEILKQLVAKMDEPKDLYHG